MSSTGAALVVSIALSAIGLALLAVGFAAALSKRGVTRRRAGPEIGAELLAEKMGREASDEGRKTLARRAWFWGRGWAVERTATYSTEEIRQALRRREPRAVWPALVGTAGMVLFPLFGGIALVLVPDTRWFGAAVLAIFGYGLVSVIRDLRRERAPRSGPPGSPGR